MTTNFEDERVLPLGRLANDPNVETAEGWTSLSPDTLKRMYPQFIVYLSERRVGMKKRHVLEITRRTKIPA